MKTTGDLRIRYRLAVLFHKLMADELVLIEQLPDELAEAEADGLDYLWGMLACPYRGLPDAIEQFVSQIEPIGGFSPLILRDLLQMNCMLEIINQHSDWLENARQLLAYHRMLIFDMALRVHPSPAEPTARETYCLHLLSQLHRSVRYLQTQIEQASLCRVSLN